MCLADYLCDLLTYFNDLARCFDEIETRLQYNSFLQPFLF
ncbi:hypothetical protein FM107_09760 [Sphingobacterium sp. JB170]|nr:hypothetical protein FM107_09760 [Sphingobacterium sp. JB170]